MRSIHTVFKKNKKIIFAIGVFGVLGNILLFQSTNSMLLLPFLFYWLFLGIIYKFNEKYFFGMALFFLVLSIPPFLLGNLQLAEKFSVWEFLFLVLGLWQWIILEIKIPFLNRKK